MHKSAPSEFSLPVLVTVVSGISRDCAQLFAIATQSLWWELQLQRGMGCLSTHTCFHLLSMGSKRDPDNDHFHLILCTDHTVQQMCKVLVIKKCSVDCYSQVSSSPKMESISKQDNGNEIHSLNIQWNSEHFFCSNKTTSA